MTQNRIFVIPFLKILFRAINFFMFVHTTQWTSSEFFLSRFSSIKPLAKKITHFTVQFCSKNLTHITNLNSLQQNTAKTFFTLQIFQQTCFCLVSEKTFTPHHFLTPQNCILEAFWKQMSVYFCVSPWEKFCFKDVVRFYLVGWGLGVG